MYGTGTVCINMEKSKNVKTSEKLTKSNNLYVYLNKRNKNDVNLFFASVAFLCKETLM